MQATVGTRTVPRGQDFVWTFDLEGSGSISGGVYTAAVRRKGSRQVLFNPTVEISDAAARVITVTASTADTDLLEGDPADPTKAVEHVIDITEVLGGETTIYGPFIFPARTAA